MFRLLALAAFCLFAAPLRAETVEVNVDGVDVTLPLPPGHCALERSHAADRSVIETVQRIVASTNRVLAAFADCAQRDEVRDGRRRLFDNFGQYMTPLRGNRIAGMKPAEFAQKMAELFKQQGAEVIRGAEAEVREKLSGMRMGVRMGENRMLGILRTDERAAYLGLVQNIGLPDGRSKIQVGIVAMGLIQERVVSLNLYAPFVEGDAGANATLNLLGISTATYEALVAKNKP